MKLLHFKNGALLTTGILLVLFCWCMRLPTDPTDVANTTFSVVFKSPTLTMLDASSFTDTLGTRVRIGISSNLTMHLDSANLALVSAKRVADTAVAFYDFTALKNADTLWFYYTLRDTGRITVSANVFVHEWNTLSDTVRLTVYARINHPPRLLVSGKTAVDAGEPCSLSFGASDPDAGQTMNYTIDNKPDSALFDAAGHFFKWTPGSADTGLHTFIFRVVDDGFPPMADSLKYDLTVTPGVGNRAPVWLRDTIGENIQPGVLFSKALSEVCSDPDNDSLKFKLIRGTPAHDTIIAATYIFTPSAQDTGSVYPMIVATDPTGAADTLVLHLSVTTLDLQRPKLKLIAPSDSAVVSSNSVPVKVTCTAASGIGWVKCSLGADTFAIASANHDSLYTATVSGLKPGIFNTIVITAADASSGQNRDSLVLRIKYDSTAADNVPPVVRLVSPAKDTVITADSCRILLVCKDAGGIGNVTGSIGQTNFTGQKMAGSDSLWQLTVKGLSSGHYITVTILATDASSGGNRDSVRVRIKYDNDSTPPVISRLDPLNDSSSISAESYTIKVRCTDASGIAALSCALGTDDFTSAKSGDSVWSVNVSGLARNLFNEITVIATDSSLRANKDTLSLYVKYDPTLDDNVDPVITCLTSLPSDMIVKDSVISLTDSVYDASGVDSVYWTLNGKNPRMLSAVLTTATGGKYLLTDTLRRYHLDTIDVYAVDKSTARNRGTQRIVFNFNVPPAARDTSVSTLMNTVKSVVLAAVSKDGDALTWSAFGEPAHGTVAITGATATYTPETDWVGADSFYVKVYDGIWSDTAKVRVTVVPTFTLTVNRTATGGTVTVVKDTAVYVSGTTVQLTATPKDGYRFQSWGGDTSATANPLTVTMQRDRSITANYRKQYTLTLTTSDAAMGSVSSTSGTSPFAVDSGTAIPIAATPLGSFAFKRWSTTAAGVEFSSATSAGGGTVTLKQANATVQGVFGCVTFKKQLSFGQYGDMVLTDAVQTIDGGYLVVGSTSSIEGTLIIRLNQWGDTVLTRVDEWIKRCQSIRKTPGGYLASGEYSGSSVAYCLAQNGNSLWGISHAILEKNLFAVVTMSTSDGGYIMGAGDGDGLYHMIKTDALRIGVWDTMYSASVGSMFDCISARDGGYIFVGGSTFDMQPYAIKTGSGGIIEWTETFTSALQGYTPSTRFYSVDTANDGGFIIAGSGSYNSVPHGFVLKVTSDGTYGNGINIADASKIKSIRVINNGDYMIAGGTLTAGSGGGEDIYIVRTSSTGTVLHSATYGSVGDQSANSLQLTADGGAIVTGTNNWIIKTDENGATD